MSVLYFTATERYLKFYNKRLCTHLRRGKQKCTNINIVDADTCTLDIAKLLKISFYPTKEQEEQLTSNSS